MRTIQILFIMTDTADEDVAVVVEKDDSFVVASYLMKQTKPFNIYTFFCSVFTIEISFEWHSNKHNYRSTDYQPWYLEHNFVFSHSNFNGFCIILLFIPIVNDSIFFYSYHQEHDNVNWFWCSLSGINWSNMLIVIVMTFILFYWYTMNIDL